MPLVKNRVAEVVLRHEGPSPKSLDSDENFKPEHTLFCRVFRFVMIYLLYKASFLSSNLPYFDAILRFVVIYVLYINASFHPDSDERQFLFVGTQMKDSFLLSRLRRKTTSFRSESDKRQLPFIKTQTKDNFFLSRLR